MHRLRQRTWGSVRASALPPKLKPAPDDLDNKSSRQRRHADAIAFLAEHAPDAHGLRAAEAIAISVPALAGWEPSKRSHRACIERRAGRDGAGSPTVLIADSRAPRAPMQTNVRTYARGSSRSVDPQPTSEPLSPITGRTCAPP